MSMQRLLQLILQITRSQKKLLYQTFPYSGLLRRHFITLGNMYINYLQSIRKNMMIFLGP